MARASLLQRFLLIATFVLPLLTVGIWRLATRRAAAA
jgi:hypothetical protein